MIKNASKILVIIINYKTSHLIGGLLKSIDEKNVDVSILIVDNASTPESYNELLSLKNERIHILRSEKNLGFTGGINYALKYTIYNFTEIKYFFLLNPDAFCSPELLGHLLEVLKTNPNAASVSPQILNMNGIPWYSGAQISYNKGRVFNNPVSNTQNNYSHYEVDVFSGCAVLFDLNKVLKAGMFNEDLFMYFDEADLSIKLKEMGYKIFYTPSYKIFHDVSYTTKNISHLKTYYMTRNKFIVFNKSMSFYNKIYFILHELAFHIKNRRIKNAIYHLKGYFDFLKGKKGAYSTFN